MQPVTGASETGAETNASTAKQDLMGQFEDQMAKALFTFGQGFVMEDLQELSNEE
jgi:hypothetical protein